MQIEYRVKQISRYIVTRFEGDGEGSGGVSQIGEYANPEVAYELAYALAKAEHERLGWSLDDSRMLYPVVPSEICKDGPRPAR